MEYKKTIPIALLVFSLSFMLLFYDNVIPVYALQIFQRATGTAPQSCDGSQSDNLVACVNTSSDNVSVYNVENTTPVLERTIDLTPSAQGSVGSSFAVNHISCGGIICISTASIGGGVDSINGRAFAYNIATGEIGDTSSGVNFTSSAPLSGSYPFEAFCSTTSCTTWVARDSGGTVHIRTYGETDGDLVNNAWAFVSSFDTAISDTLAIGNLQRGVFSISGSDYPLLALYTPSGTQNFRVYNLGTSTIVCNIDMTDSLGTPEILFAETSVTNGDFWLFVDNSVGLKKITQTTSSCTVSNTMSNVANFEGNGVVATQFNTNTGDIYGKANDKVYVVNGTSFATSLAFTSSATSVENSMFYDASEDVLTEAINTDNVINFYYFETSETPDDPNTGGIDCNDPEFSYRLICNLEGAGGLTGASNLINQSSTNIACQIGLLSCTQDEDGNFVPDNADIQTNGIGYLLVAIALGIMIGIFWVASRGDLKEIPTFVWFIGTVAVVGAITAIGWVNPTFLIIAVITIVAFAVAKARGLLGGSGLFSGD